MPGVRRSRVVASGPRDGRGAGADGRGAPARAAGRSLPAPRARGWLAPGSGSRPAALHVQAPPHHNAVLVVLAEAEAVHLVPSVPLRALEIPSVPQSGSRPSSVSSRRAAWVAEGRASAITYRSASLGRSRPSRDTSQRMVVVALSRSVARTTPAQVGATTARELRFTSGQCRADRRRRCHDARSRRAGSRQGR